MSEFAQFSLVSEPWIPVLTRTGMHDRSLVGVFNDDVVDIATGDDLEDAALTRLLLAVHIAAADAGATPVDWLNDQRGRFDLFDSTEPFWQNPDMARHAALPGAVRSIISASYRHTGRGSAAVNLWHAASGITYSPADAARLLVVRQQFSVGGIQQFTTAAYGKAPISAKTAVATNRPLLWLDTGTTLADSLAHTAALTSPAEPGKFWFTWPAGAAPADTGHPTGILDALTWPARSILLTPPADGTVAGISICDGLRWPEPHTDPAHTLQRDAELNPYTAYARKKDTDTYTPQSVHTARPIWRQLAALCADPNNPAASWQPAASAAGARWRLTGLGSYQSAISGPLTGSFPAPRDPAALAAFLDALTAAATRIASTAGSLAHGVTDADGYTPAIPGTTGLEATAAPLAAAVAAGQISSDDAAQKIDAAAAAITTRAYAAVARVRPLAAGRIAARKDQPTRGDVPASATPKGKKSR